MPENQVTQRLAEILGQIAKLPQANPEPPQFFANFLQLSVAAAGGRGGAVWVIQPEQPPQCYCHVDLEACRINEPDQQQLVVEAIARTAQEAKVLVIPPAAEIGGPAETESTGRRNQCPHTLFFKPLRAANRVAMVLQIVAAEGLDPKDFRVVAGLLDQIGETAETYLVHRRATVLDDDRKSLAGLLQYAEAVHASLDPEKVIYQVANLGRDAIACNRVMVWVDPNVKRGLHAVSGIDKPDRRAVLLQSVEKLCRHCLTLKQPIVASRPSLVEMPEDEELTVLLRHYFNASQLDQIFLQPMQQDQDQNILGVLVAEGFDEQASVNLAGVVATAARHGAVALANALEMAAVPLVRPFSRLKKTATDPKRRRRKLITIFVLIALALTTGLLMPWTIKIDCLCELTPAQLRVVDAPIDGVQITAVLKPHGLVNADDIIVQLSDDDLRTQLYSLQAALAQETAKRDDAKRRHGAGSPQANFSQLEVERLEGQKQFIERQIAKCQVKSPITGTILTDQLELREGMTVARGDVIFEVADLSRWELLLQVPQEESGWVLRGLQELPDADLDSISDSTTDTGLLVEFYLAAYPEHRLAARLSDPDQLSQVGQVTQEGNIFEVRIPVDHEELGQIMTGLRDGSVGRAKIATADRPLAYVMLRKVIRFFRVTFF